MRSKILKLLYDFYGLCFKFINFNKPKILFYTDSRGYDVIGNEGKNPFKSYIKKFIFKYNTDFFICKEKHTTILDFLELISTLNTKKYDFIILHCGVVDFSPRPISNLNWVLNSKINNKFFQISVSKYAKYFENPSDVIYNEEKTNNLYSPEFLKNEVLPELKKIKNLIWINSNHFVENWEGNFTKGRPKNIEEYVSLFDNIMKTELKNIVDLRSWNETEIKKFTIDNIHFNKNGFLKIYDMIDEKINLIYGD